MISPKHTLLLIVILAITSIFFVAAESFYGMSPGTLDQLQSTSVHPIRRPYLLF